MRIRNRIGILRFALRPPLQYSLRSLLAATLVTCLALGWYVERVRCQKFAVAALTSEGATVYYYDDEYPAFDMEDFIEGRTVEKPRTLAQWAEFLTPARLRTALGIDFFRRVDTVRCDLYSDFPHDPTVFSQLPDLRTLELYHALDEDLVALGDLSDLANLFLHDSVISDAGLAHLGRLRNLESLSIYCGAFQQYVDRLENDTTMLLGRPITDAGLAHLAGLRRLTYLCLCGSAIRGEGLRHLAGMSELDSLDLWGTRLTDDGLVHLTELPRLRHVDISCTLANPDLAAELLPAAEITSNKTNAPTLARSLMHCALWDQALGALQNARVARMQTRRREPGEHPDGEDPSADLTDRRMNLYGAGWCHAELGHWHEATEVFCNLLREIHAAPPEAAGLNEREVWMKLYRWPPLFESVAAHRPGDYWYFVTAAQRAVLDGRWLAASASYARAMEIPEDERWEIDERWGIYGAPLEFEYVLSRLVLGDLSVLEPLCTRWLDRKQRAVETIGAMTRDPYTYLQPVYALQRAQEYATRLRLVAPQGTATASQMAEWRKDEHSLLYSHDLVSLGCCRYGNFTAAIEAALDEFPHAPRMERGRFWFYRAFAYQHIRLPAMARDCYARGAQWLERHAKDARLRGAQGEAPWLLEAEVLRRESERLIFNP